MEAVDGNAIAGTLYGIFGGEMTAAGSVCAHCGETRRIAELAVYLRAPGTVVRCRACEAIVMVFVEIRGVMCVDLRGLEWVERPA
jgi:hypothetical protein